MKTCAPWHTPCSRRKTSRQSAQVSTRACSVGSVSQPFFALRRRTSADEVLRRREPRNGRRVQHAPTDDIYRHGTTTSNRQELAALKVFLSLHPHLQWAHGSAIPLFEGLPSLARIESVLLSYTDAALFGLVVRVPTIEQAHVRERSQSMCSKVRQAR